MVKKQRVFPVKILTQSQELRKFGRSFPEGPEIFLLILLCSYYLSDLRDASVISTADVSKNRPQKVAKTKKTPKSSQVFFSFFWNKKLHPLPTFNKKTKKTGRGTPTWMFFFFFGEVYLATNVRILGAVPQAFEVDG